MIYVHVLWESCQTALLQDVPLILSIISCALVKKVILDINVSPVPMVSMAIPLCLVTTARGVCVVAILIQVLMEAVTLRQDSVLNVSMLQWETNVTIV